MALLQGDPLPDIRQTTTTATEAPGYFSDYLSGLAQAGKSALVDPTTGQPKTGGQLVAEYDPLQTSGYGKFESAATAAQPGIETAKGALAAGTGVSAEDIGRFMNPYTQNVVEEMARLQQQNLQRNLLPTMKAGFVGTGGLGGQRYAGALGQSLADVQANLTGQQYGALSQGYKQALDAAMQEAGLQQKAAGLGTEMAGREQELGLAGAQALTKAGAERQAYEQSKLEAPLKQASNVAALMRGYQIPTTQTQTFVGPKEGTYGMSPLQSILGVGTLLGAAKQGSLLDQLAKGIGSKLFPGVTTGTTTDALDTSKYGEGYAGFEKAMEDIYGPRWYETEDFGFGYGD